MSTPGGDLRECTDRCACTHAGSPVKLVNIHGELAAAGFDDVRPRDLAVLQWPGPDGMRAIDIAANASMSKQAVKPLIDHLEQCGYLERVPDPDDHRAQRIHTTPRGQQLMAAASAIITQIEQDIAAQLGSRTHAQLRATLEELATITTRTPAPPPDGSHRTKSPRRSS
jgi:DNA-binding MarR family transcriptional regulator